jgi:FkbM family methyltransferase
MLANVRARIREARWYGELVRESRRYALRELVPRASLAAYSVRPSGLTVLVRHHDPRQGGRTPENWPLHEVFRAGEYEPPPIVNDRLRVTAAPRVVDVGANVGFFGVFVFGRFPSARVVGFEPDPRNLGVLRDCVARNALSDRWEVIGAGAASAAGTLSFVGDAGSMSRVAGDGEQPTEVVPAVDVFPYLLGADLVKIDIEGSEWPLLEDARLAASRIGALVIEYHSLGCPEPNPKAAAARRLRAAGFTVDTASDDNPDEEPFWGRGILWAWR